MRRSKARKYAQGFVGALPEGADLDQYADEVVEAAAALGAAPALMDVLSNPGLPSKVRAKLADDALASAGATGLTRRFLSLLVAHGHAKHAGPVAQAVRDEVNTIQGVVAARIGTARPLDAAQENEIVEALSRAVGRKVRPSFEVDKTLLAGVVGRVGDLVFDGSGRRQLALMRDQLTRAS